MLEDVKSVLLTEQQLAEKVQELGRRISEDYKDKNLMLISVLKGSFVFMADLVRAITIPVAVDFMAISSYGSGVSTSGEVRILKDLDRPIENYDILVVEDILDSGLTLSYLLELLQGRHPRSVKICTILNKPDRRKVPVHVDYDGYIIPDEFVVGYGLDYDEKYRNLPFVGVLDPRVYMGK